MLENLTNNTNHSDAEPSLLRLLSGIIIGIFISFAFLTVSLSLTQHLSKLTVGQVSQNETVRLLLNALFYARIFMVFGIGYVAGRISGGPYLIVGLLSNIILLTQQLLITSNFLIPVMIIFLVSIIISSLLGAKYGQQRYQILSTKS